MRRLTVTTMTVAILVGSAVAAVAPAAAEGGIPVLHRDGEQAVPFHPVVGGGELVLRRDGSEAASFVGETTPQASATHSGFDWGDATIGAATASGLMLLGIAALMLVRRTRPGPAGSSVTT